MGFFDILTAIPFSGANGVFKLKVVPFTLKKAFFRDFIGVST